MAHDSSGVISIRNVPEDLHRNAKVAAAQRGVTLREFILDLIEKAVDEKPAVKGAK